MGRSCGQVVSILPLYSDDPSSYPDKVYIFSVKYCLRRVKKMPIVGPKVALWTTQYPKECEAEGLNPVFKIQKA